VWESLEQSGWVQIIANSGLLYASISVIHYFTLFFFIGATALVDLRVLGVAGRNQTIAHLAEQLLPWTWIGFALASISGFLLFTTAARDFAPDRIFQIKMLVILLAVVSTVMVQNGFRKWNQLPAVPASAKLIAFVSLVLWLGAILAAVDVSYISGIG
jgi:hypothetical protein